MIEYKIFIFIYIFIYFLIYLFIFIYIYIIYLYIYLFLFYIYFIYIFIYFFTLIFLYMYYIYLCNFYIAEAHLREQEAKIAKLVEHVKNERIQLKEKTNQALNKVNKKKYHKKTILFYGNAHIYLLVTLFLYSFTTIFHLIVTNINFPNNTLPLKLLFIYR